MLDKQTLKEFEMVVRRQGKGTFLGFLGFGFSSLLAFPFMRGIKSELNDKLSLKGMRGDSTGCEIYER